MKNKKLLSIVLVVTTVHLILTVLFFCTPVFCADPGRLNSLHFPEPIVQKMSRLGMSFNRVRSIIQNGHKIPTSLPYSFIYVYDGSCAVLDESTVQVTDVIKHSCVVPN